MGNSHLALLHAQCVCPRAMLRAILAKVKSLLVFTILTASTIGPGTVAMCSKAGADFKTSLLWCVLVASVVAFVLQEGAGTRRPERDRTER